jgi:hypothetical protein
MGAIRYDLRKLKGHGPLERDGGRYAYRLTSRRIHAALLFLFFHKRLYGPRAKSRFHHQPDPKDRPNRRLALLIPILPNQGPFRFAVADSAPSEPRF